MLKQIARRTTGPTAIWVFGNAVTLYLFNADLITDKVIDFFASIGITPVIVIELFIPCGFIVSTCVALVRLCPSIAFMRVMGILVVPCLADWAAIKTSAFFLPMNENAGLGSLGRWILSGFAGGLVLGLILHLWLLIPGLIAARGQFHWKSVLFSTLSIGACLGAANWLHAFLPDNVFIGFAAMMLLNFYFAFAVAVDKEAICRGKSSSPP